jgi:hypothetical protein
MTEVSASVLCPRCVRAKAAQFAVLLARLSWRQLGATSRRREGELIWTSRH